MNFDSHFDKTPFWGYNNVKPEYRWIWKHMKFLHKVEFCLSENENSQSERHEHLSLFKAPVLRRLNVFVVLY